MLISATLLNKYHKRMQAWKWPKQRRRRQPGSGAPACGHLLATHTLNSCMWLELAHINSNGVIQGSFTCHSERSLSLVERGDTNHPAKAPKAEWYGHTRCYNVCSSH